jgi:hypothetical protein
MFCKKKKSYRIWEYVEGERREIFVLKVTGSKTTGITQVGVEKERFCKGMEFVKRKIMCGQTVKIIIRLF